jgi:polar amino acid transport system substrate-binding protein
LSTGPLLSACGASGSTLDTIKKAGSVTIGYDSDPPWSFRTTSGQLTGIAAEVATATFKELGVPKVNGLLVDFGDLIPGVLAKRFDSIGDSLFITPQRCGQVYFSNPFAVDGEALVVARGNPLHLTDFASVAHSSATLGIIGGSAETKFAADAGVNPGHLVTFGDVTTAVEAVGAGRVDAVAYDVVALAYTVSTSKANVDVTPAFTAQLAGKPQYGANAFIFRKSDGALRDAFNKAQAKLLASGQVDEIANRFVKGLAPGIVQARHLSVAQLCATS